MDWRILLADSLKAMTVNADVTVIDNGVQIEQTEQTEQTENEEA